MSAEGISSFLAGCEEGEVGRDLFAFLGVNCCCIAEKVGLWLLIDDCLRDGILNDGPLGVAVGLNCWLAERPWSEAVLVCV